MNKYFKLISQYKYLLLIVLLASVLRFAGIDHTPPSLNWDEISHGYNAYSILQTGKDEWGKTFPVIFRAYGDYKLPVYIYLTAVSEIFFGLTSLAVRLPSVLAGITSVVFTYLLSKELLRKSTPSVVRFAPLIASLLVAIEPWSLFLSRGAFEANVAQALVISGVYFFLKGLKNYKLLAVSSILLGLSVWTYNSARVFVPLLLVFLILIFWKTLKPVYKKSRRAARISFLILLVFLVPMLIQLANPEGSARYSKVAILDGGAVNQIIEARNSSFLSPTLARVVHNKGTYFVREFGRNYVTHFSPNFLFTDGGDQYQFSVPENGLLSLINLPFFYLGLVLLISLGSRNRRNVKLLLIWFILAPIPSSLTREAPHVLRSITMLPIPMIVTAYGFTSFAKWLSVRFKVGKWSALHGSLVVFYVIILFASLELYLNNYFVKYREDYSWSWQYGYEQVVGYAKKNYEKYDKIIVTKKYGEPHEFFLFYNQWDPVKYRNDPNLNRFEQSEWFWVDGFDKFYFVNDWQVVEEGKDQKVFNLESKREVSCKESFCLLITSPGNVPAEWRKLETISFLDGSTVFEIYEN